MACKHCGKEEGCICKSMDRKKTCKVCGEEKWLKDMAQFGQKGFPEYKRRSYCKACRKKKGTSGAIRRRLDKYRTSDKKRGLESTLTAEQLREILSKECSYCGSSFKMTADRKDNSLGHTFENCVPACFRCNIMRTHVPYDAWLMISVAVKQAFEAGLLPDWDNLGPGVTNSR